MEVVPSYSSRKQNEIKLCQKKNHIYKNNMKHEP